LLDSEISVESSHCGISGSILVDRHNAISFVLSVMVSYQMSVEQKSRTIMRINCIKPINGYEKNRLMIQEYKNSPSIQNNKYFCNEFSYNTPTTLIHNNLKLSSIKHFVRLNVQLSVSTRIFSEFDFKV
jgi:hypothetical protein